jgi:putative DNA primase/helicase
MNAVARSSIISAESYDSTEDAVAERFAARHPDLRWCQVLGKWFVWDGAVWKQDDTVHVFDQIRRYCRENSEWNSETCMELKKQCSASFVAAVERFCKSDRRFAATVEQFDQDDWILNTPDGLVDLRTGLTKPHNPIDYCTKTTLGSPIGECHRWREFLGEVTDQDVQLIDYLQRLVGYCLTGSTREHSLHFLYGTGGNGKSVFLDTVTGVLGDYAKTAPMETFTESRNDRHPTELAMLQGARLVVAQETEQGKRWAQSRIKALTGGDRIAARRMRQDFFEYNPKFKLLIAGNAKPKLDTVDEAMRRRFHIIPFTVQILPEDRDKELTSKLREEGPGILAWAIEGCLEYQKVGLNPPAKVIEATDAYLESQDVFSEWLETECECGPGLWETPTMLYGSWRRFADRNNERVGRQSDFRERMEAKGFHQMKNNVYGRHWAGVKAKTRPCEDSWTP